MPKLRATPQQRREKALMVAIARAKAEHDLETDLAVADLIGLGSKNYSNHKKAAFQHLNYDKREPGVRTAIRIARALNSTVEDLFGAATPKHE